MKGSIRKIVIICLFIISIVVVGLAVVAGFFEDQVGKQIVKSISSSLDAKLTIDRIDLSLIRAFPNAAVNLNGFVLEDSNADTLMSTQNLSFRVKLLSIFSSKIEVSSIIAENGRINIQYDKKGKANYEVFKETSDSTSEVSNFLIALKEATLKQMAFSYVDAFAKQQASILIKQAVFSGQFSNTNFDLTSKVSLHSDSIVVDGERFLANKDLFYDTQVVVDMNKGTYQLEKVNLDVEGNKFDVAGMISTTSDAVDFDVTASNEGGSLEAVLQWLPQTYLDYFGGFSSSGKFYFKALVNGRWSQKDMPAIDVTFGLKHGRLSNPNLTDDFKDVSFDARFNNGETRSNNSSIFEMPRLQGYFDDQPIEASLSAENLDDPFINCTLTGAIPLKSVYPFLGNPKITKATGKINVNQFQLKGRYSDMISLSGITKVEVNGGVNFEDITLLVNEEEVVLDNGRLLLEGNKMTIDSVKFLGVGNEIYLNGEFYNVLPVLFADSLNTQDVTLEFNANLKAPVMDIDRLIGLSVPLIEKSKTTEAEIDSIKSIEVQERQQFTQFLKGTFNLQVGAFNYGQIDGKKFVGILQFSGIQMNIAGNTEAMEGRFDVAGTMYFLDRPYLKARLGATDIDAQKFFYQAENFGQNVLTDKHLRGRMSSKMAIHAYWDEKMNFLYDQLRVLAQLDIKNGELIKFEMFEDFGNYIKIDDLKYVKFKDLQNWVEVRNQRVFIPVMFIQSNALNLTLNGEYTFNYEYDFNFKINAGQVLFNRMKKYNSKMKPLPAKEKGMFNMYATVFGNPDKYEYKMAAKAVKEEFERSEQRKQQIRMSLEDEFGVVVNLIEPPAWEDTPTAFEDAELLFNQRLENQEQENEKK